jgi:hypothetical protein
MTDLGALARGGAALAVVDAKRAERAQRLERGATP